MNRSWVSAITGFLLSVQCLTTQALESDEFYATLGNREVFDILANDNLPEDARILSVTLNPSRLDSAIFAFSSSQRKLIFMMRDDDFDTEVINYSIKYYSNRKVVTESADITIINSKTLTTNAPPMAVDDYASLPVSTSITLYPLENDYDIDGDILQLVSVSDPEFGQATVSGNTVTYTADALYIGQTSISYVISDGAGNSADGEITITTHPETTPNHSPVAAADSITLEKNRTATLDVLQNDFDEDNDALYISSLTNSISGLTATIENDKIKLVTSSTFNESGFLYYTVSDGQDESETAAVEVIYLSNNRDPIARNDLIDADSTEVVIHPLVNDSDPDNDELVLDRLLNVNGGTAAINGSSIIFNSYPGVSTASILYRVKDSAGNTALATIQINIIQDEPPIAHDDSVAMLSNRSILIDVLNNDTDNLPQQLQITEISTPLNGSTYVEANQIRYSPDNNYSGTDTFTYTVTDNVGQSSNAIVTITITKNTAPLANNDFVNLAANTTIRINVLDNDVDVDNDSLTVASLVADEHAEAFTLNADGSVFISPPTDFEGILAATYVTEDESSETSTAGIRVRVHSPIANIDNIDLNSAQLPGVLKELDTHLLGNISDINVIEDPSSGIASLVVRPESSFKFNGISKDTFWIYKGSQFDNNSELLELSATADDDVQLIHYGRGKIPQQASINTARLNTGVETDLVFALDFGFMLLPNYATSKSPVDLSVTGTKYSSLNSRFSVVQATQPLDFNNDGVADLAIALGELAGGETKVRIVFGPFNQQSGDIFADQPISSNVFDITGFISESFFPAYLSLASGDINGDGIEDLIVGQSDSDIATAQGKGIITAVWGREMLDHSLSLEQLNSDSSRSDGVILHTLKENSIGATIASDDFNADGIADIVVSHSNPLYPAPENFINYVSIVSGRHDWQNASAIENSDTPASQTYTVEINSHAGSSPQRQIIHAVNVADINNDNYADLILQTGSSIKILTGDHHVKPDLIDLGGIHSATINADTVAPNIITIDSFGTTNSFSAKLRLFSTDLNGDEFSDLVLFNEGTSSGNLFLINGGLHFR